MCTTAAPLKIGIHELFCKHDYSITSYIVSFVKYYFTQLISLLKCQAPSLFSLSFRMIREIRFRWN